MKGKGDGVMRPMGARYGGRRNCTSRRKTTDLTTASEIMAEQMEQEKVMRGKTVLVLPLLLLAVSCGKAETASSAGTLKAGTSSGDYAPAGSALERTASADPVLENTVSADSTIASTASAGAATADAAVSAEERKEQERDHCEEQIKEEMVKMDEVLTYVDNELI